MGDVLVSEARTLNGEGERKRVSDALVALCLGCVGGEPDEKIAARVLELAPVVVRLVKLGQIEPPQPGAEKWRRGSRDGDTDQSDAAKSRGSRTASSAVKPTSKAKPAGKPSGGRAKATSMTTVKTKKKKGA